MFFFRVISFNLFWKFLSHGNLAWDALGGNFWFRDFLGFLVFPPFHYPQHLKSGVPPPPLGVLLIILYKDMKATEQYFPEVAHNIY